MIHVEGFINQVNGAHRKSVVKALRLAKHNAHDFTIPAADRITWREIVPFLRKQLDKYDTGADG